MARLIDADKRIAEIKKIYCDGCDNYGGVKCRACWVDDAMCLIEDATTVDAVEVVRCKDCKLVYRDPYSGCTTVTKDRCKVHIFAPTENGKKALTMDEYIKREYARDAVLDVYFNTPDIDLSCEKFEAAILKIPASDVAPVRHGRWLDVQETDMYVPDLKLTATKTAETCSVCRARIGFIGAKLYLFDSICPSCGARMDKED